jgi:hypothetical protein
MGLEAPALLPALLGVDAGVRVRGDPRRGVVITSENTPRG